MNDPNAFVFSISNNTKHHQYDPDALNILHNKHTLIGFGSGKGFDILIRNNCDKKKQNKAWIGQAYKTIGAVRKDTAFAKEYLAGAANFNVIDIEVYSVK